MQAQLAAQDKNQVGCRVCVCAGRADGRAAGGRERFSHSRLGSCTPASPLCLSEQAGRLTDGMGVVN